jgi:hypothetical protein
MIALCLDCHEDIDATHGRLRCDPCKRRYVHRRDVARERRRREALGVSAHRLRLERAAARTDGAAESGKWCRVCEGQAWRRPEHRPCACGGTFAEVVLARPEHAVGQWVWL